MTVAPLLSLDTLVAGAEGSAGMVLGDLKKKAKKRKSERNAEKQEKRTAWFKDKSKTELSVRTNAGFQENRSSKLWTQQRRLRPQLVKKNRADVLGCQAFQKTIKKKQSGCLGCQSYVAVSRPPIVAASQLGLARQVFKR